MFVQALQFRGERAEASNHTTSRCTIPALCKLSRVPSSFLAADMHAGKESFLEKETEHKAPSRGRQGRGGHRRYLCTASSLPVISLDETCPARPGQAHVACGFHSPPHSPDATYKGYKHLLFVLSASHHIQINVINNKDCYHLISWIHVHSEGTFPETTYCFSLFSLSSVSSLKFNVSATVCHGVDPIHWPREISTTVSITHTPPVNS